MLLDYKSLHDGLNQAEINALYSILRKETIFTETLLMDSTGKYGVYNIVDTGIQVVNAIPTGQYAFNFSDGTVGVGVANDEGIVDVDISFDRSSVCDVVITFPPYVVRINYNLSLSGDKSIIQKNESVVVTALLTMDGSVCSGKSLSYSVKHGSSVIDSGTITTGSDGTASISYTGTGVGNVSVEVTYSTLLQETYEVKDGLFIDTSTTPNNKWWSTATTGSITHNANGITFNNVGTGYSRMHPYIVETFPSTWSEKEEAVKFMDTPFIVEFNVKSISNTNAITLDTNSTLYSNDVSPNDHVKLVCDGSTGKVYINDVEVNSKSFTFTNSWFAFRITSTVELKIDNFVIYPV